MTGNADGSDGLERYRNARASQEELKLATMRGELIPITKFQDIVSPAMRVVRGAGDTLVRRFGNEAGEILTDAVDEAQREMARLFEELEKKGGAK